MKILVIGSGGREHALCWAVAASPLTSKLYCAPGNGGISQVAKCVAIEAMDFERIHAMAHAAGRHRRRHRQPDGRGLEGAR